MCVVLQVFTEPIELGVNVGMNLCVHLLFGMFLFHGFVDGIVSVVGSKFAHKGVDGVRNAGRGLVAVNGDGAVTHPDQHLHGSVHCVFRVPVYINSNDKRQKAGTGKGVITSRWRLRGVRGLAGRHVALASPPVGFSSQVRPSLL